MIDLISRQDALKGFAEYSDGWCYINALPSAELERKNGKWEIYIISMLDGEGCKCSECEFEGVPYWNFCPNCGADMRGEEQ